MVCSWESGNQGRQGSVAGVLDCYPIPKLGGARTGIRWAATGRQERQHRQFGLVLIGELMRLNRAIPSGGSLVRRFPSGGQTLNRTQDGSNNRRSCNGSSPRWASRAFNRRCGHPSPPPGMKRGHKWRNGPTETTLDGADKPGTQHWAGEISKPLAVKAPGSLISSGGLQGTSTPAARRLPAGWQTTLGLRTGLDACERWTFDNRAGTAGRRRGGVADGKLPVVSDDAQPAWQINDDQHGQQLDQRGNETSARTQTANA